MPMLSKTLKKLISTSLGKPAKLALIVRSDLKMGKGKTAAQCAHAAIMCYENAAHGTAEQSALLQHWGRIGQPKIVLRVDTYEQLSGLQIQAQDANLVTALVRDAGRTQLEPGTATVLGLGPASDVELDKLVAHLKLL
ncbi:peptidyl-tRNA hydrolase 2, mitochondrial [Scaptodrosophila lebanonensis]|uniref:peptidyl-tRNA hydrolase n=1 Tax=Drosophila lebanonensis TaxID=7225 RepID=A0A6J2TJW2_DROLE|nr:peptidyl-tRNA hydrolase 2, mitochondrial [Scaptodrosophila lebanonensis]